MPGVYEARALRVPIAVWVLSATANDNITAQVSNVTFRHTAPGGFADCSVDLNRPLDDFSPALVQYARLRVTDTRNGSVLWEGRLEDPGKTVSGSGQVWSLVGVGLQAHAKDITAPYVAVDRDLSRWVRGATTASYVSDTQEDQQDGDLLGPSIRVTASTGNVIPTFSSLARMYYPTFFESGQLVGSVVGSVRVGPMTGPFASEHLAQVQMTFDLTMTSNTLTVFSATALHFPTGFDLRFGRNWTSGGENVPVLQWFYDAFGGNNTYTADSNSWVMFGDRLTVRPIMHRKDGTTIPPATNFAEHDSLYTSTSEIVADLLGSGRLPKFDGVNAAIAPSSDRLVGQFAYPDPVTTDQLLTDLMVLEPTRYWAVWELGQNGKARFEWALWPTQVRYVIPMEDGMSIPTSTEEIYNAVSVRWKDALGRTRRTRRTSAVPMLTAAGLTREAAIDLGDNIASIEQAEKAGDGFLADHAAPFGTGTLTVARPVMDRFTGRMVSPWEIRPGCLVQVAGVDPSAYSQGAKTRNGRNVFRVIATDFSASSGTVSLDLDSPPNSIWDQIAEANRSFDERRRR